MKTRLILITVLCLVTLSYGTMGQAQGLNAQHLADHGLPAGPALEILPGSGALIHLQLHDLLGVLEGVEEILVAGIPEKAVPPDVQGPPANGAPSADPLGHADLTAASDRRGARTSNRH